MNTKTVLLIDPEVESDDDDQKRLERLGYNVIPYQRVEAAVEVVKQSQYEFNRFFDLVPDLMCVVSRDGFLVRLNDAWERTLGFSKVELMSRPLNDFLHPDDVQPTLDEIGLRTEGDSREHFENRYRTRDGDYRWFEWRSVLSSDGYLYAGGRDVTEKKAAEESLRKQVDRNRLLLKELRHRVKNSLAAVAGLLSIGAEAEDNDSSRESLMEARGRIDSVSRMYDNLRHSTDNTVELARYVEELARSVVEAYSLRRGMDLEVEAVPVSESMDDVFPVGLILNELLTNVFKHAYPSDERGRIRVTLQPESGGDNPGGILSVTDYGKGFPEGFSFDGSRGTGLNLIESLVQQIGGSISLSTDDGNTVSVRFPVTPSDG
jgi:PAS domain S-box-containing protein